MNDQIQAKLLGLLEVLEKGIQVGAEKLPGAAQYALEQIVLFYWASFAVHVTTAVLLIVGFMAFVWAAFRKGGLCDKAIEEDSPPHVIALGVGSVGGAVTLIAAVSNLYGAGQDLIRAMAPIGALLARHL